MEIEEKLAIPFTLFYPNLSKDKVFIQWSSEPKGEIKHILQSISGQAVQSSICQPSEGIDYGSLAYVVYHFMLWSNGQPIGAGRLVVE